MRKILLRLTLAIGVPLALAAGVFFGIGFFLAPQNALEKADAIVAISGGDTEARTAEAVRLYRAGYAPVIIFSGAALDPNSPSNAEVMGRIAAGSGVPQRAIVLDEAAVNTRGNASGVARIVRERGYDSIILVTSPYHQRRAGIVFGRVLGPDVRVMNHSAIDHEWRRSRWWDTPGSVELTLEELQKTMYEIAAGAND